jgi:hypothetical protein
MRKKLVEGDWFGVPLRTAGYAIGVAARHPTVAPVMLAYFFGPRLERLPTREVRDLRPSDAILVALVGDLGVRNGSWTLLPHSPHWSAAKWPLPRFVRQDALTGGKKLVAYDPTNLMREASIEVATDDQVAGLPRDGVYGYGAVEIVLTEMLCPGAGAAR